LNCCYKLPEADLFGEDAVIMERDPKDPEDVRYRIQGFTARHRMTMLAVALLRFLMICVLAVVGVSYIIKTNEYADLIMNGVALGFIAQISSVLYTQVLREEIQDQTSDIKPMSVDMIGLDWLNRRPALLDMICVLGIWVAVIIIMAWQLRSITIPVYDSLECTCLSQGSHCVEANKFSFEFWHDYWLNAVPRVFKSVQELKSNTPEAVASYLTVSSALATGKAEALLERVEQLETDNGEMEERMEELDGMTDDEAQLVPSISEAPSRGPVLLETQTAHRQLKKHSRANKQTSLRPDGLRRGRALRAPR